MDYTIAGRRVQRPLRKSRPALKRRRERGEGGRGKGERAYRWVQVWSAESGLSTPHSALRTPIMTQSLGIIPVSRPPTVDVFPPVGYNPFLRRTAICDYPEDIA